MPGGATGATQNENIPIWLETFEKERLCSFPQRHGDGRAKPEIRDETYRNLNRGISCETSSILYTLQLQNRSFPTSFLMDLKFCYRKIHVSCEDSVFFQHISQNAPQVLRLPHKTSFQDVTKHVGMSQSATFARRNEATRRLKFQK